jgi:hypothetical protein
LEAKRSGSLFLSSKIQKLKNTYLGIFWLINQSQEVKKNPKQKGI